LQVVLDTLKKEEERKLQELVKALEEAEKAIKSLVMHQASLNIDNLTIQGGAALKLITDDLRADAERINLQVQPPFQPSRS